MEALPRDLKTTLAAAERGDTSVALRIAPRSGAEKVLAVDVEGVPSV